MFAEILANGSLLKSPTFRLHLIGRGEVEIPPALSGVVVKEENLPYQVPSSAYAVLAF